VGEGTTLPRKLPNRGGLRAGALVARLQTLVCCALFLAGIVTIFQHLYSSYGPCSVVSFLHVSIGGPRPRILLEVMRCRILDDACG